MQLANAPGATSILGPAVFQDLSWAARIRQTLFSGFRYALLELILGGDNVEFACVVSQRTQCGGDETLRRLAASINAEG